MPQKLYFKLFVVLVALMFMAPLVFWRGLYLPFTSAKTLFFYLLVQLALPFYIFVIANFPEYRPSWKNPVVQGIVLFVSIGFISAFFGIDFQKSFWGDFVRMGGIILWLHLILFFLYLLLVFRALNRSSWLIKLFISVAVIASIKGILEFFGLIDPATEIFLGRALSFFGNPIFFAAYLVIPFFLCLFFLFQSQTKGEKIFYSLSALIILLGIFSSGTRGALLGVVSGLGIGMTLFLYLNPRKYYKKVLGYGLLALVIIFGIFAWLGYQSGQASNLRRLVDIRDQNTQNRLIQWKTALAGTKENLILGVGPENYYYIANKYFDPELYQFGSGWSDKPHNLWLEILTTTGVVGLIAYFYLLGGIILSAKSAFNSGKISLIQFSVFVSAVGAYQIQNLFAFDNISALTTFIVLAGLAAYWNDLVKPALDPKQRVYRKSYWPSVGALLLVCYFIFLIPISNAKVLSNLNKAINLGPTRPVTAKEYFDQAFHANFSLDREQVALKYEDFISTKLRSGFAEAELGTINKSIDGAIEALETVAPGSKNLDVWINLANLYVLEARVNNAEINPRFEDVIKTSLELGPKRMEALAILADARRHQGRDQEAEELLRRIEALRPGATKE